MNKITFTIRPYQAGDQATLEEIAVLAWEPVFASFKTLLGEDLFAIVYPDWQTDKRQQIASACRGDRGLRIFVAVYGNQPVGFASFYTNARTKIGEIGNNAVHPDYQGNGIGTILYKHVLDAMRDDGMQAVKVTTGGDPSHAPARRAYHKAGFEHGLPSVTYFHEL